MIRKCTECKFSILRIVRNEFFGTVFNKHGAVFFLHKGNLIIEFRTFLLKLFKSAISLPISMSCVLTLIFTDSEKEHEHISKLCNVWQISASLFIPHCIVFVTLSIVFR